MRSCIALWLCGIIFAYLAFILFINRETFTRPFDAPYWKDKYEQSQWVLPRSIRIIGDDGLYLAEGYRLINGGNPAERNAEMPPLGKYIIGITTKLIGNGNVFGFLATTSVVAVLFFLAKKFFQKTILALLTTILVAIDPLITNQFTLTMLDAIQLFFALLFFLILTHIIQKQKPSFAETLFLGVSLGLFAATKFPLFAPVLGIIGSLILWKKTYSLTHILAFIATTSTVYVLSYIRYFLLGHSLIDFLKLQKWMISFYQHQSAQPTFGSILTTLFFNRYQNLFTRGYEPVSEWSLSWPIITIASMIAVFILLQNRKRATSMVWLPIATFAIVLFGMYNILGFWTRYLVLILPFFYLLTIKILSMLKHQRVKVGVIIFFAIANLYSSFTMLFPTPQKTVNQFTYDLQYGFFQDIYEYLPKSTKVNPRKTFHRTGQRIFFDGEIENVLIDILPTQWSRFDSPQKVNLRITFITRNLGSFTETPTLSIIKENGIWKIPWHWDTFIQDLNDEYVLETTVSTAKRGNIFTNDERAYTKNFDSFLISVTPEKVKPAQEQEMLTLLAELFDHTLVKDNIYARYTGNRQSDWPVPIGIIPKLLTEEHKKRISSIPALTLSHATGREVKPSAIMDIGNIGNSLYFECCSFLYSTTNYDGISGKEKEYNELLKGINGGSLVIKDKEGNIVRTIIKSELVNGKDIKL